ncbi:hypothetical protein RF11_13372 [Thelohanellus kitauei]|uniref:Uncharacterized protein n=1 Tax=Thelohanellus kitauei TaxID=669202 RepID=A0A0C2MVR0_THEKT|nr:hypothetical protein RF11_13372 [Thelohanellus kitauei]
MIKNQVPKSKEGPTRPPRNFTSPRMPSDCSDKVDLDHSGAKNQGLARRLWLRLMTGITNDISMVNYRLAPKHTNIIIFTLVFSIIALLVTPVKILLANLGLSISLVSLFICATNYALKILKMAGIELPIEFVETNFRLCFDEIEDRNYESFLGRCFQKASRRYDKIMYGKKPLISILILLECLWIKKWLSHWIPTLVLISTILYICFRRIQQLFRI